MRMELSNPVLLVPLMTVLGVLPFLLLGLTSFVKIQIVLGLLKLGMGAQQIPSSVVTSLFAMVLTVVIMKPVFMEMHEQASPVIAKLSSAGPPLAPREIIRLLGELGERLEVPLADFLRKHSRDRERRFFAAMNRPPGRAQVSARGADERAANLRHADPLPQNDDGVAGEAADESFLSLAAAFVVSELRSGFLFGFLLFLPFLVVDLFISNLLVAMGMSMVSPATIALPVKIGLFLITDSWFSLAQSLLESYR